VARSERRPVGSQRRSGVRSANDLHIALRGLIRSGYFADFVAFDPRTIAARRGRWGDESVKRG